MSPAMDDSTATAQSQDTVAEERLVYRVSWMGITIGSVRMNADLVRGQGGGTIRRVNAAIDSKAGIPFVSLHFRALTDMDSTSRSIAFRSYEQDGDVWIETYYQYDLIPGIVVMDEYECGTPFGPRQGWRKRDTVRIPAG